MTIKISNGDVSYVFSFQDSDGSSPSGTMYTGIGVHEG